MLAVLAGGVRSGAQETKKPADQPGQEAPQPEKPAEVIAQQVGEAAKKPIQWFTLLDRKSLFFPDIAVSAEPLSPFGKFALSVNNSVSIHTVLASALGSAFEQADGSPTGFGQGWNAYGERFGTALARESSAEFFGTFVLASALHEDPRFFRQRDLGFGHGVKYSLKRIFITRSDDGRQVVNVSGLMGPLLAEGLANVYWPEQNRTVGDTLLRYGLDLATRAGGNLMRQYWPVVYQKLEHSDGSKGKGTEE